MPESYWFTKVIPSCVACSTVVAGVIQFIQVTPLQIELTKEKEKVKAQTSLIKTTKVYQDLQKLYLEEKVKREMLDEELKGTSRLEIEKRKVEIELQSVQKQLTKLEKYSDYESLAERLATTELRLEDYKSAHATLLNQYEKLQSKLSLKDDLKKLNEEKKHLETILDCMSRGCTTNIYYTKYDDKYEPVAFEQYRRQLNEANKNISIIYSSIATN